jgi:hypothetical protein
MKTKNNNATERTSADSVLTRYQQYAAALVDTGTSIPQALSTERRLSAELGRAEIEGGDADELRRRLAAVVAEREAAARRRAGASEALLGMADDLRRERAVVAQGLAEIAQSAINDFGLRWARACSDLGRLVAEAGVLGAALRCTVATPPPYVATLSADGMRMLVSFAGHIQPDTVTLTPEVSAITARLDQFDAAGTLIAALGQAHELTERHHALCQQRRAPSRLEGVFEVVKGFSYLGTQFTEGMLLDRSVLPDGALYRFQIGRNLRAVEGAAVAA